MQESSRSSFAFPYSEIFLRNKNQYILFTKITEKLGAT